MSDRLKTVFTREELHDLVWSTPIEQLARRYGFSDRGFAKICERHIVPVPPRGYWAKINAGQPAKRGVLRSIQVPSLETVHVVPRTPSPKSDYLAEVLASIKAAARPQGPPAPLKADVPRQTGPTPPAQVIHDRPVEIHQSVRPFLDELRSLAPDRDGYVRRKWVDVPPSSIDRVGTFLSTLLSALSPYDFSFAHTHRDRVGFLKDGHLLTVWFKAPRKRVFGRPGTSMYGELMHVGRLQFHISGSPKGIRDEWTDTDARKIEQSLSQMVDSILVSHAEDKVAAEERAAAEKRRAHLLRRRELAALRAKREVARREFVDWLAGARKSIDELRATISRLPDYAELSPDYERMLAWAQEQLNDLESKTTVAKIQAALVEKALFPVPDDLYDPEGDPPPKQNYWDD